MIQAIRSVLNDKRGNVLIMVGFSMPLLIGAAGLATDTIQWTTWKRQIQRAADSAAFAGVYAGIQGQDVTSAVSTDTGYNNNTGIALYEAPAISFPPDTPDYSDAVEVELKVQKKLPFSSFFLDTPPIVTAKGRAAVVIDGVYCVQSLEKTSQAGIVITGNGSVNLGCGMHTNSVSLEAAQATGSAAVTASPIAAVGGINLDSVNWGKDVEFRPFNVEESDPFEKLEPDFTEMNPCNGGAIVVNPSETSSGKGGATVLNPGCYSSISVNGNAKFNPGVYYINGGNLSFGAQAVVTAIGVSFVLTNKSSGSTATIGNVNMNAGAEVNLVAPSEGESFAGIAIYQDRRATDGGASTASLINGTAKSTFQGAFYFPNREVTFNGTSGMTTKCLQLVARRVYFSGNSSVSNSCDAGSGVDDLLARTVRLVG